MSKITTTVQNEFWFHVSNQDEIPIFGEVDNKALDIDLLIEIVNNFPASVSNTQIQFISSKIKENPETIDILRTFVAVSDKRMYLELSYIFAKTKYNPTDTVNVFGKTLYELDKHPLSYFKNLLNSRDTRLADKSAEIISKYLIDKQLIEILLVLKKLTVTEINTIVEKLILPKEIQQAEAKRRGHGAEQNFAELLFELGVNFIPKEKHLNPMSSSDPNVEIETFEITKKKKGETWSFDLIIENHLQTPLVFLQGLIHTSDPGQYGVNKSDETVQIKNDLEKVNQKYNTNKELWGLVDGVGFSENKKDTIDKMLTKFDCFVQLKSLFKAGLRLHKLELVEIKGIRFDTNFYTQQEINDLFVKYGSQDIQLVTRAIPNAKEIQAGKAWLYI